MVFQFGEIKSKLKKTRILASQKIDSKLKKIISIFCLVFYWYSLMALENTLMYNMILTIFLLVLSCELFSDDLLNNKKIFFYNREINLILGVASILSLLLYKNKTTSLLDLFFKVTADGIFNNLYIWSFIFLVFLFIGLLFFYNGHPLSSEKNNKEELLSFREKELEEIKKMIDDDKIQTILVDSKIGTGKTKVIQELINRYDDLDIIYLKLPLIENIDELKKNVFLEIKYLFKINRISNYFIDNFFNNISVVKTNFFEMNLTKKSNWENIKQLKDSLRQLEDKGKKIIIILDDLEREKKKEKIEEAILFLGELSEYFRETKTTVLFLADYDKIMAKIKYKNSPKEGIREFYDKYFKVSLKLKSFDLIELKEKDLSIIIKDIIEEKNQEDIAFINDVVKIGIKSIKNNNLNERCNKESIRNLEKFILKIKLLKDFDDEKKNILSGVLFMKFFLPEMYSYNSLYKNNNSLEAEERFMTSFYDEMQSKYHKKDRKIEYSLIKLEARKIIDNFKKYELDDNEFSTEIEKIKDIVEGKINEECYIVLDYLKSKFIVGVIENDLLKLKRLFEKKIILERYALIDLIGEIEINNPELSSIREVIRKNLLYGIRKNCEDEELHYDNGDENREEIIQIERKRIKILKDSNLLSNNEFEELKEKMKRDTMHELGYY